MGTFKCNYETVTTQGQSLLNTANEMEEDLNAYHGANGTDGTLGQALSSWKENDTARPSFNEGEQKVYEMAKKYAEFGQKLGRHIKSCSASINTLDNRCAGLKI